MDLTQELNLDELIWRYLVANTPRYLYKYFRQEPSIWDLKTRWSSVQLETEFKERKKYKERTAEDTTIMYAILVALTFFRYDEACETIRRLQITVSDLEWGEWIFTLFKSTSQITQHSEVKIPPAVEEKFDTSVISSSISKRFIWSPGGTVKEEHNAEI